MANITKGACYFFAVEKRTILLIFIYKFPK